MIHIQLNKQYQLTLFLLIFFVFQSNADNQWGKATNKIKFKHLQVEHGLSSNVTSSILQDHSGFIWFGTDAGLNRYDGIQMKTFKAGGLKKNEISNGVIKCIFEDHKNQVWVGTEQGLNRYKPIDQDFNYFLSNENNPHSLSNNTITSITEDENKNLWVGTFHGLNLLTGYDKKGIPEFKRIHHQPDNPNSLSSDRIYILYTDKEGNLWIGTEGGGLNLLSAENIKTKNYTFIHFSTFSSASETISDNMIYSICQINDGSIYIGTNKNLSILKKEEDYFCVRNYPYPQTKNNDESEIKIFSIHQDNKNRIWLATFGEGLIQFKPETGTFEAHKHQIYNKRSISRDFIYTVYSSSEGILWLATRETGIDRIDPYVQRFIHLSDTPEQFSTLSNKIVKSIAEGHDGKYWFGTYGGGLNMYNPKTKEFIVYKNSPSNTNSISSNIIESISFDHLNRLWIGTSKGLNLFEPKKNKFTRFEHIPTNKNSLTNNNIWSVLPCKDKTGIWIATYDGLDKYDWNQKRFYHFKNSPKDSTSLSFNYIRSILEDNNQNLWICTWGGGLDKLDLNKYSYLEDATFEHFRHEPEDSASISSNLVNTLFLDQNNQLWVGTQTGLNKLDESSGTFNQYTERDGLADNVIKGIRQDSTGIFWISTQKGLSKFNPIQKKFTNYFKKDGLQGNIFNLSSCTYNSKGEMMFGGNSGVSIFHPEEIIERTNFPPIYISKVKINSKDINPGQELNGRVPLKKSIQQQKHLELKYDENTISIEFSAIEYSSPEKINFSYRLENAEENWNYTDYKNRQITYSGLKPGTYTFRLKSTNFCGEWSDRETNLSIIITPPIWATPQAYIIYVLLLLAFISYIGSILRNRIRIRKELQHEKEEHKKRIELNKFKLQFFTNVSHEIRTPLTLISLPLQKLMDEGDQLSNTQKQNCFQSIDRNVNSLLRLVNQLLDFRKIENSKVSIKVERADICQLIYPIIQSFTTSSIQKKIEIYFDSEVEKFFVYTDNNIIEKILNNLLSNALKFTPTDGTIKVKLHASEEIQIPSNIEITGTNSDYFCISVEDNGVGIPKSQLDYIFERFTQLPNSTSTDTGTGIGLALTKKLIETHKGYISVESSPEEGSTFYVWLPANRSLYEDNEVVPEELSPSSSKEEQKETFSIPELSLVDRNNMSFTEEIKASKEQTLLIVEDNDEMRFHIKDILKFKYNILEACNGKEGLEVALLKGPDLIITDVMMPVMNGLDFCKNLKNNLNISHIPVIMLTAKNSIDHEIEGLEQGADQYISKPFKINQLKLIVRNLLTTRKQLQLKFTGKGGIPSPKEINVTSADEKLFEEMIENIENHISDPDFSVEMLAKNLGLSSVHLYRKLKSISGMTPNKFIRSYRLKSATQLLKQNKLRISEVGYMVGFSDPKYFRKCFKTEYGKSPSEYAKDFI